MTCTQCGSALIGRRTTFCSKPCAVKGNTANRRASGRLTVAGGRVRTDRDRAWTRETQRRKRAEGDIYTRRRLCKDCGANIVRYSKFCEPCARGRIKRTSARKRINAAARDHRTKRLWVCATCGNCNTAFTVLSVGSLALPYCLDCTARRRKKLPNISKAKRTKVYERDNWTCHICGDPVNRNAKPSDLDAPTIDHVIARARGGAHCPDNWATAHRWCNSLKRDLDLADVA